jgi:chemotaxis protein CheC
VDLSGISEFGNILSASFINAISDGTKLPVRSEAPEISVDMCLAVIDGVLGRFNLPGDHILLTQAVIFGQDSEQVVCRLLMFLEPASLRRLVHSLTDASTSSRR